MANIGDNTNIQDRVQTQKFIKYAGCHTNAGKSHLGALIKGVDGELRAPNGAAKTYPTSALTLSVREGCQILKPKGRVQVLGTVHCDERRCGRITEADN